MSPAELEKAIWPPSVRGFSEALMSWGRRTMVAALLLAFLVAIPVLPLSSGNGRPARPSATERRSRSRRGPPWFPRRSMHRGPSGRDDPTIASGVAARSVVGGNLTVALTFWPSHSAMFEAASSPAGFLTPPEIAQQYGLTPSAYSAIEHYFLARGVGILHEWPDRLALTVRGPADAVDAAFDTQVVEGTMGNRTVEFPGSAPSLPAPFSSEVAAVSGLSDAQTSFELPFARTDSPAASPLQGRTTSTVDPNALHTVYGFDQLYNYSGSPHYATRGDRPDPPGVRRRPGPTSSSTTATCTRPNSPPSRSHRIRSMARPPRPRARWPIRRTPPRR